MVTGSLEEQRVARLERELEIRDREEHAARREMMRLTERLAQQTRELARTRRLEQTVSALSVALRQTGADIERALDSRAWRLGHSITRTLSRIARRPVRTEGALVAALARIERVQEATHIDLLPRAPDASGRSGSGSPPTSAPLAPVPRRPLSAAQARELERMFAGLTGFTSYPQLEVVVVDNGSRDDTVSYLEGLQTLFSVHVLSTGENLSFAQANARGVERAGGELLLFLNNDVEPFEAGWLKELVCALGSGGVEVVGATLLHGEDPDRPRGEPRVQHRAIRFRWQEGTIKAFNDGDGDMLWDGPLGLELRAPAVT